VVVVESALIFETKHLAGWRERFDTLILVTAPEATKIARFVARSQAQAGGGDRAALEAEAKRRLGLMVPDEVKAPQCEYVIENDGSVEELRHKVDEVWGTLSHRG